MRANKEEIKNYLHKLVVETEDESILSRVQAYFINLKDEKKDWWDTLSDQEKKAIQAGKEQLENGEGIPDEEVRKKVDRLLGRQ